MAAAEPTGPSLPLAERARRLFADDGAPAVFAPDGALLHAGTTALQQLNGATTLEALGLETVANTALASGHASGTARHRAHSVAVTLRLLGEGESRVLMLTWPAETETKAVPLAAEANARSGAVDMPADQAALEQRQPLRFVWQMDADGRFAIGSDEFIAMVGPRTIAACGRRWREIAAELKLDPDG